MVNTLPEHQRVKISTGVFPAARIQHIAASHPFTQQIDIVFPSSDAIESALCGLGTHYQKQNVKLSEVIDAAHMFVNSMELESDIIMLSTDTNSDDAWCIDHRGLLTLSLSKETYEQLGLVGKKLPFKNHPDQYVVHIPLQRNAESSSNRARRNAALQAWDSRREQQGFDPWNVVYHSKNPEAAALFSGQAALAQNARCQKNAFTDVHIPLLSLTQHPPASNPDREEDWNAEMAALFEWVGMACLGAQRLRGNDRVDPYVALYEPPSPSRIGDLTHLRWKGLLDSEFVQSVVDAALSAVNTGDLSSSFVAITSQALPIAPVSYISPSTFSSGTGKSVNLDTPVRVSRANGDDTWCMIVVPETAGRPGSVSWSLVESVGQWDTRWG